MLPSSEDGERSIGLWRMLLPSTMTTRPEMMPVGNKRQGLPVSEPANDGSKDPCGPAAPSLSYDDIDQCIAQALQAEQQATLPIMAEIVTEVLAGARERHRSELRERETSLKLSIAKLEAAVSALQLALDRDDRKNQSSICLTHCAA
jgi:hypothetical protein